jgi:hypothetical protein
LFACSGTTVLSALTPPTGARLLLAIDVGERLPVGVADDETLGGFLDGPRWRETAGALNARRRAASVTRRLDMVGCSIRERAIPDGGRDRP